MAEFFHMGGYAFFVWGSYAVGFIVLLANFVWPLLKKRKLFHQMQAAQARQEKLARRQS